MAMNRRLKDDSALFASAVTFPANTTTTSSAIELGGGNNGAIQIVVEAQTACALADTKIATVTVTSSATSGGTYTPVGKITYTASGAKTFAVGDIIGTVVLNEECLDFVKVAVTTDDAGATGTYNAFAQYLPR